MVHVHALDCFLTMLMQLGILGGCCSSNLILKEHVYVVQAREDDACVIPIND